MKPETSVVVDVRAVDVGYFSVKLTFGRKVLSGIPSIAVNHFPSLAPRLSQGMSPQSALNSRPNGSLVEVDGVEYFVGRDVNLFSSGQEPRDVLPDYCLSSKYLALVRGAMHYMWLDAGSPGELVIKHLVLGLPLTTYQEHRERLQSRVIGEHLLPDATQADSYRRITVENCSVIVQPQGALVNYGNLNRRIYEDHFSMVVDAGGGTLDWFVTRGRSPNWQRSGAYNRSMLACSYAVTDKIDRGWRDNFDVIERIDRAICEKRESFTVSGRSYRLSDYESDITAVLKESVDRMQAKVVSFDGLDTILFTGGGGALFYEYFRNRFPHLIHIMHIDEEPLYSNVKGFQLAGEILSRPKLT